MVRGVYAFEQIDRELSRPPLASLRATHVSGLWLSHSQWAKLPDSVRRQLIKLGTAPKIKRGDVQSLVGSVLLKELHIGHYQEEPEEGEVPEVLGNAMGPGRSISLDFWQAIRPLDRFVLTWLATNTFLLMRAMDEIAVRCRLFEYCVPTDGWTGMVACCEVRADRTLVSNLESPDVFDGRACLLARAAGVRVARRTHEFLDLYANNIPGVIQLGWRREDMTEVGVVRWQGHASTVEGEFFPAAAVLAVSTAAAALYDILTSQLRGSARIDAVRLLEEPWIVGGVDGEATGVQW